MEDRQCTVARKDFNLGKDILGSAYNIVDSEIRLSDNDSMKVTVELSDSDLQEICRMTGEKKKGPAIRRMVADALMMKRREEIAQKFISGELRVQLSGFEEGRAADRKASKKRGIKWRG